jgi:hypothetical protein
MVSVLGGLVLDRGAIAPFAKPLVGGGFFLLLLPFVL